jgi:hypothetical protein
MPEGYPTTHDDHVKSQADRESPIEHNMADYKLDGFNPDTIVRYGSYLGTLTDMIEQCPPAREMFADLPREAVEATISKRIEQDQDAARAEMADRARAAAEAAHEAADSSAAAEDSKKKFLNPFPGQNPLTA